MSRVVTITIRCPSAVVSVGWMFMFRCRIV
jgi:hypothetical protein